VVSAQRQQGQQAQKSDQQHHVASAPRPGATAFLGGADSAILHDLPAQFGSFQAFLQVFASHSAVRKTSLRSTSPQFRLFRGSIGRFLAGTTPSRQ
jgi:hypothetical protein